MGQKKTSAICYLVIFVLLIGAVGAVSLLRLSDFYVRDEAVNNEWTVDMGSRLETDIATNFFGKYAFVDLNGGMRRLLGEQEMNGVVKLDNGYLMEPFDYCLDETLDSYSGLFAQIDGWVDEIERKDVPVVYCAVPYSSDKNDPELPAGVSDFGNDDLDRFLVFLREKDVDTIDFRKEMRLDGYSTYDFMYHTDHHWTTEAGLYAYGKLADYLTEKLDCTVDSRIRDAANYDIETYPRWHLGSYGQRTGSLYAGIDDFKLFVPKFPTTIVQGERSGTMDEMLYNREPLEKRDFHSRYTYDAVLDAALGDYTNPNAENDKKILLITDSFGKAVSPFLNLAFSEVRYMYDGTILNVTPEYLADYQPDAIVIVSYVGIIPGLMDL